MIIYGLVHGETCSFGTYYQVQVQVRYIWYLDFYPYDETLLLATVTMHAYAEE